METVISIVLVIAVVNCAYVSGRARGFQEGYYFQLRQRKREQKSTGTDTNN